MARGDGFHLVERLSDEPREVLLVGLVVPAFDRDSEDGDPGLGGQTRGWVADAALAQRVGDRRGEGGELDQLALLELWVRGDDGLPLAGVFAALLEDGGGGLGARDDRRRGIGRAGDGAHEEVLQCARAREQNLELIGEVEERRPTIYISGWMTSRHYNSRQTPQPGLHMTRFELTLTALTLIAVITLVIVFLFVFHDFPLRVA